MLRFEVKVIGIPQMSRAFSRFGEGIKDYRPVWKQMRDNFFWIERQQFQSQGARGLTPWVALTPEYAAWKQKHFPGKPILQLTGQMKADLTGGRKMTVEMQPMLLRMRPHSTIAKFHQLGTIHMNRRPVVVLAVEDKNTWIKYIHNYIYDKQKEARLL